jgi:hypothetical protein
MQTLNFLLCRFLFFIKCRIYIQKNEGWHDGINSELGRMWKKEWSWENISTYSEGG